MAIALISILALAFVVHAGVVLWQGADDPEWRSCWERLDDLDRAWLAAAGCSRADRTALAARGELGLAKGIRRREMRNRSKVVLAILPPFLVVAVLIATGVLGNRFEVFVLSSFACIQGLVLYISDRQLKSRYRKTQERHLARTDAGTVPTA